MRYKITNQYRKDQERLCAAFETLSDAKIFLEMKIASDNEKSIIVIYRVYDHDQLLGEINKEKMSTPIARAQYAQGDIDLPISFTSGFHVKLHCESKTEDEIIAKFFHLDDARIFMMIKLKADREANKKHNSYLLFDEKQCIEKMDQGLLDAEQASSQNNQNKKSISFKPTPLAMTLRLGPHEWLIDDEDDKDNKE